MKKLLVSMCLCSAVALGAMQAQAATVRVVDSSQVNLTAINSVVAKQSGGVPVGTVITWPFVSNPEDAENWLECNGQSVSSGVYPELFAIVGNRVPDLRNQFMRGGTSAQVGQVAGDSTRSHAHAVDQHSHTVSGTAGAQHYSVSIGPQSVNGWATGQSYQAPAGGSNSGYALISGLDTYGYSAGASGSHMGGGMYMNGDYGYIPLSSGGSTWSTTGGSSVSGATSGTSVSGWTGGSSITGYTNLAGPTSTHASGSTETAPQHMRVRYLIRALP